MAPTMTVLTGKWPSVDGSAASGQILVQPVVEQVGGGWIMAAAPFSVSLGTTGTVSQLVVSNTDIPGLQYLITELINGVVTPPYVIAPVAPTVDLSSAPRGVPGATTINPLYLLASRAGVPSGLATLGSDGILTASQRPAGSGGFTPVIRPQYITDGDILLTTNTAGAWAIATRTGGGRVEIDVPASVGHWVEIGINGMRTGAAAVDVAVVVGTSQVRYLASGTGVPANDGDTGWYAAGGAFFTHGGTRGFTVTGGDLDGANVRLCLVFKSTGTGTINATAGDPFYWVARNIGPTN